MSSTLLILGGIPVAAIIGTIKGIIGSSSRFGIDSNSCRGTYGCRVTNPPRATGGRRH